MSAPDRIELDDLTPPTAPFVRDGGGGGEAGEKDVDRHFEAEGFATALDLDQDIRAFEQERDRRCNENDQFFHNTRLTDSGPSKITSRPSWGRVNEVRGVILFAANRAKIGLSPASSPAFSGGAA